MLSEADDRTLRMTALTAQTNAALPRLSHVVRRLTRAGVAVVQQAAPGHVANVREHVLDALSAEQVEQLGEIADALLGRLDPSGAMMSMYRRHDDVGD